MLVVGLLSSCSRLPDLNRMQDTMDRMAHYTGVMASNMPYMAQSTARMAAVAERMEGRSGKMISELQSRGDAVERTFQNYAQSFIDNDRALIKTLKDIRQEIGELRMQLKPSGSASSAVDQSRNNEKLQEKLTQLESQLTAISRQMAQRNETHKAPGR